MNFERRVLVLALASGAFGTLVALALLWLGDHGANARITLTVLMLLLWLSFAFSVRGRIVYTLQTLSNLLAALREGDYSIRGRMSRAGGSLDDVIRELNLLGETLREQRLDALEASALLRKVMEEINIAVFTFDGERRLRLTNRAGERMLGEPAERLLGRDAADLGLAHCLDGETARTVQMKLATGSGPWEVRRGTFREKGAPHHLLVLADLSRALREEERQVWQRLIRVLGHELNNSLAPVKSIVQSLVTLLTRPELPADWREDALRGLSVIGSRTESLTRFMEAYARLARLPAPRLEKMDVGTWIRRAAALETRLSVTLVPGPELGIRADGVQLEQLLINLVRNAVDAAITTGGGVEVGWRRNGTWLEVVVVDEGPGLQNTANLFVPFFTTKPSGTGIGLVLSRQIAEAHGGSLTLENRGRGRGCEAKLKLPLDSGTRGPGILP
jgi:PAS domain S-box-containing protein